MSWVEVTGGYGYRYRLAFSYPSKTHTRITGVTGWSRVWCVKCRTTLNYHYHFVTTATNHYHLPQPSFDRLQPPWHTPTTPATTKWCRNTTATSQGPAGSTLRRGDDVAHQQYLPNVLRSLTVVTHTSSNHDDDGWEVREERVQLKGQQLPKFPFNWQNPSQPLSPQPLLRHDKWLATTTTNDDARWW